MGKKLISKNLENGNETIEKFISIVNLNGIDQTVFSLEQIRALAFLNPIVNKDSREVQNAFFVLDTFIDLLKSHE